MLLTIFTKRSILDVWLVPKNATKSFNKNFCEFSFFSFSSHLVKCFSYYYINRKAQWNFFGVVNSVILQFPAIL